MHRRISSIRNTTLVRGSHFNCIKSHYHDDDKNARNLIAYLVRHRHYLHSTAVSLSPIPIRLFGDELENIHSAGPQQSMCWNRFHRWCHCHRFSVLPALSTRHCVAVHILPLSGPINLIRELVAVPRVGCQMKHSFTQFCPNERQSPAGL